MFQEQLEMLDRQSTQMDENETFDNRFIDSGISPGYLKKNYDDVIDEKGRIPILFIVSFYAHLNVVSLSSRNNCLDPLDLSTHSCKHRCTL